MNVRAPWSLRVRAVREGAAWPVLLLAALVVAASGCGGAGRGSGGAGPGSDTRQSGGTPRRPVDDATQLRRLLDTRAAALRAGDAAALAATATGAQRSRDRAAARRARGLGLTRVRISATTVHVDGRRASMRAEIAYRVRGVAGQFVSRRRLSAVRIRAGWRVRALHGRRQRPPWEVAAFRRVRTRHFVVLAPPGIDPGTGGLLEALEAGYERMRGLLERGRLRRRYLVVIAADAVQARLLTAEIRGLESLAALTDSEVRQEGPAERVAAVSSQRLLVVWPALIAIDSQARTTVITHELSHAVLAPGTSGRTPGWLVEGIALYVSGDRRVAEVADLLGGVVAPDVQGAEAQAARRALTLTGLSHPDRIARLDGPAQSAAYAYASAAAFYIADRYGRAALLELYYAYNDEALTGEAGDPTLTDEAVRRVLGISLATLERNLRRWVVTRALVDPLAP